MAVTNATNHIELDKNLEIKAIENILQYVEKEKKNTNRTTKKIQSLLL